MISLVAGAVVYLTCSLVLGTFEREDYVLLGSVQKVAPGKSKKIVEAAVGFLSQFKQGRESSDDAQNY